MFCFEQLVKLHQEIFLQTMFQHYLLVKSSSARQKLLNTFIPLTDQIVVHITCNKSIAANYQKNIYI